MFYQRKLDRAMKWNKEQRMRAEGLDPEEEEIKEELRKHSRPMGSDLPTPEEIREEAKEEMHVEKGDMPAMIFSAMITILPVCLAVLLVLALIAMLLFGGFN